MAEGGVEGGRVKQPNPKHYFSGSHITTVVSAVGGEGGEPAPQLGLKHVAVISYPRPIKNKLREGEWMSVELTRNVIYFGGKNVNSVLSFAH